MSEIYQCVFCGNCFPVSEAIDGFSKGYCKGFLCPVCGINIEETEESNKDITSLRFGYTYLALNIFAYIAVNEGWFSLGLFKYELANLIFSILVVLSFPTAVFIYINRNTLFGKTIINTRRIVNQAL